VRVGDQEEFVREFKFKDPRSLALQAMGEIRNQLKLRLDIFQTLFSLQAAKEFEDTVVCLQMVSDKSGKKLREGFSFSIPFSLFSGKTQSAILFSS
jgi:hypothetical protein